MWYKKPISWILESPSWVETITGDIKTVMIKQANALTDQISFRKEGFDRVLFAADYDS